MEGEAFIPTRIGMQAAEPLACRLWRSGEPAKRAP
jgi:hypothetical protein